MKIVIAQHFAVSRCLVEVGGANHNNLPRVSWRHRKQVRNADTASS